MNNQNNEPAFPFSFEDTQTAVVHSGMSLRDYFAAKALQGMLSNSAGKRSDWEHGWAKFAYAQADAMLEARKK
jgi:hypothetical protein